MLEYRRSLRDDEVQHIKGVVEKFLEREQRRKEEAEKEMAEESWNQNVVFTGCNMFVFVY